MAFAVLLLLFIPFSAAAQPAGEVVAEPICFVVRNEAPYTVYGSFVTELYTAPDGNQARHRSNFRLEAAGEKDENGYPADRGEFCSYGPFFEGRKLELTLRTLVPIFTCKTRIDAGEIVIQGRQLPEGGTETKALCHD